MKFLKKRYVRMAAIAFMVFGASSIKAKKTFAQEAPAMAPTETPAVPPMIEETPAVPPMMEEAPATETTTATPVQTESAAPTTATETTAPAAAATTAVAVEATTVTPSDSTKVVAAPVQVAPAQGMITGSVIDEKGTPMTGASVSVKGKPIGSSVDANGKYTIAAQEGDVLVFNMVGYNVSEKKVGQSALIDVKLKTESVLLDEVVAVGYGSQSKRDVTGSIVSVKGEEIASAPGGNAVSALQGKVAGVQITNSGTPGAAPNVKIRGTGSLSNSSPLYVVDGIFTQNIDFLNPSDIESMEILKDASSLAMFGVQGANGVIIITTKRAKAGETNVSFDSYVGSQAVTKNDRMPLTNGDQYRAIYNHDLRSIGKENYDFAANGYMANTDWQDEVLQSGIISNNNVTLTSSTDKNKVLFSAGYFTQESVYKYENYDRFNARLNEEFTFNDNFKVGADITYSHSKSVGGEDGLDDATKAIPAYTPGAYGAWNKPPFQGNEVWNPVAHQETFKNTDINTTDRVLASAFAELKFLEKFTAKVAVYTDQEFGGQQKYTPAYSKDISPSGNNTTKVFNKKDVNQNYQMDNTLTYQNKWGDHALTAMGGMTTQYTYSDYVEGSRDGTVTPIPNDPRYWYVGIGSDDASQRINGMADDAAFLSFMFRANYSFKDRYLLNVSVRQDGSSKFAPDQRWGTFPSVGAGWIMSDEEWMQEFDKLNFFKVKASWGMLGNDKVGNYLYYPVYENNTAGGIWGDKPGTPGLHPLKYPNENLSWEITTGTDLGFESVWLDNRLNFDFNYYNKITDDLLVDMTLPATVGIPTTQVNAGSVQNTGIEIALGWHDEINEDWSYGFDFNAATNHNEVLSLGNSDSYAIYGGNGGNSNRTMVGHSIGSFYGYKTDGVWQTQEEIDNNPHMAGAKPGDLKYKDMNGDGQITDADRTYLGSAMPTFTWGFAPSFKYKNWDFAFQIVGSHGNYVYESWRQENYSPSNYTTARMNSWHGPGTSNYEPINNMGNNNVNSDYYMADGSYIRLQNIQFGYTFNDSALKKIKMSRLRLYCNIENAYTWQNTAGYSPEVYNTKLTTANNILAPGVNDGSTRPIPATISFGLNANF